ncbi:MAG: c-type cytochrome [Trueperaceae bacterium]
MLRLVSFSVAALILVAIGLAITASQGGIGVAPDREIPGGRPDQGPMAFVKYGCGGCHEIAGVRSAKGKVGPSLTTLGERAYIAGNLPNTPENLVLWIINPQGIEPGTAMPNLGVTQEDARSMAAYIYSLH